MSYYDYEDYYSEPSEIEQIIEDAKGNIEKLLRSDIVAKIEEVKKLKEQKQELKSEIRGLENDLLQLKQERKQAEEYNIKELPKKVLNRIQLSYTKGIKVGDKIYKIYDKIVEKPCPYCNGKGEILAYNNEKVICPKCYGHKTKPAQKGHYIKEHRVSNIDFRFSTSDFGIVDWKAKCIYCDDNNDFSYRADQFYTTREEAEAAINELESK